MIAMTVAIVFLALGLVHVYWALGGSIGFVAALPTLPSQQAANTPQHPAGPTRLAFKPSAASTLAVAAGLVTIALMVALRAGLLGTPVTHWALAWGIGMLATIMFARAVGDFRLVGFFKKVTSTPFAQMDTWAYSPLCVALGFGLAAVALT